MAFHIQNNHTSIITLVLPPTRERGGKHGNRRILPGPLSDESIAKANELTESEVRQIEACPENAIFFQGLLQPKGFQPRFKEREKKAQAPAATEKDEGGKKAGS